MIKKINLTTDRYENTGSYTVTVMDRISKWGCKMKNNSWMMLVCCLGPLLLFVIAPAPGLNKQNLSWILIPVMLLICFMMLGKGGGCCGGHDKKKSDTDKQDGEKKSGCH